MKTEVDKNRSIENHFLNFVKKYKMSLIGAILVLSFSYIQICWFYV
jgi:hypothetical protein